MPAAFDNDWKPALEALPLTSKLCWDHSLKRLNTWRIGGNAACFIEVESPEDLSRLLPFLLEQRLPWFIVGKGSNLLFPDELWPGVILRLGTAFKHWEPLLEPGRVKCGAALTNVTFAQRCQAQGWGGMEFLIGVPGTMGGAIAMNAGAHGAETAQYLQSVTWMEMSGEVQHAKRSSLNFAYRHSPLNGKFGKIILEAVFQLELASPASVAERLEKYLNFRAEKQPRNLPNCGSVFKNPPGQYAAQLIEAVGLKGKRIGDAQISEKHSNFIVNLGEARAQEVLDLIALAQEMVWQTYGIRLEPEVQIVAC